MKEVQIREIIQGKLLKTYTLINDKKEGMETIYNPNGSVYMETRYVNGLREGEERIYNVNGSLRTIIEYKNDKKYIAYELYPNRSIYMVIPYHNDKIEGIVRVYYLNGKVKSECRYENGIPSGEQDLYNEQGDLISTSFYKDGVLVGDETEEIKEAIEKYTKKCFSTGDAELYEEYKRITKWLKLLLYYKESRE